MTHRTRAREEHLQPSTLNGISWGACRLPLVVGPLVVHWPRLGDDVKRHLRVLRAAEFCALSAIEAGGVGLEPERLRVAWDEIFFPSEVRRPEAVNHVLRREQQQYRLTNGDVNLIGGGE